MNADHCYARCQVVRIISGNLFASPTLGFCSPLWHMEICATLRHVWDEVRVLVLERPFRCAKLNCSLAEGWVSG